MSRLLNMNKSSFSHVRYSKFGFFSQEVAIFRKNLKIDSFLFCIKHKTTQNKELKYRRKNIVWPNVISEIKYFFGQTFAL